MRIRLIAISLCALAACGGDDKHEGSGPLDASVSIDGSTLAVSDASTTDAGMVRDATTAPPQAFDCVSGTPQSYLDILNACTDAEKVVKNPVLPLLTADGGLPPLP